MATVLEEKKVAEAPEVQEVEEEEEPSAQMCCESENPNIWIDGQEIAVSDDEMDEAGDCDATVLSHFQYVRMRRLTKSWELSRMQRPGSELGSVTMVVPE